MKSKGDVVSALLWCLAGYDLDLQFFAQIREHLPEDEHARACMYIERALRLVLESKMDTLAKASPDYQWIIKEKLGEPVDVVTRAHELHRYLITDTLTSYAMMLGALSAYGTAPWDRYKALVHELWEARFTAAV